MSAGTAPGAGRKDAEGSSASWARADRIGLALSWAAGILLCVVAAAIVIYMAVRGIQFLRPQLLFQSPEADLNQARSGGFLDPLVGTFLLTVMATAIAAPLGVATAIWLTEYGRPAWLARPVESGVEVVAGTPSIVLAIFGLLIFQQGLFGVFSITGGDGEVLGRSFFAAAAMMSFIALPLVVGATREALQAVPNHVREASYALGKTKAATIRRVLLPAIRPGIGTGAALGMGRIAGDTAIVVILLGATLKFQPKESLPLLGTLQGTGSTLTSYVYGNSPAGEGDAPEKAYAAAFMLLLVVIGLNYTVDRLSAGRKGLSWTV